MTETQPLFKGLKCRECDKTFPAEVLYVCDECFGPLEVDYRYDAIAGRISREKILSRAANMWRYRELLPVAGPVTVGEDVGYTPLVKETVLNAA